MKLLLLLTDRFIVKGTLAVGPRVGPLLGGISVTADRPRFDDQSNTLIVVCKFRVTVRRFIRGVVDYSLKVWRPMCKPFRRKT